MPTPENRVGGAEHRLRRIEPLTDAALAYLGFDELLDELLDRAREILAVDTAAVLLMDHSSDQLVATAARGIEEEVRQGVRIPVGRGFAGRIAVERGPVIIDEVDHRQVLNPLLLQKGIRSLLGVPLLAGGDLVGILHVGTLRHRRFTEADADLLRMVADRVALAAQAHLAEGERAAALALARSLVPGRLPDVPGLELSGRYVAGGEGDVGGDWYDVFTLPDGRVCLVVGDVVGRGLHAAVVMGRLRSAVRAYALELDDPADVVARVDRKLQHFEPAEMATVQFAVLDPSFERLRLTSAGHPAPVVARPGEPATFVDVPADPPLGVRPGIPRRVTTVELAPGAVLCFYTDGLVERRGVPVDARLELLRSAVAAGPVDEVCAQVMLRLVGAGPPADDTGVLIARRIDYGDTAPLDMVVPALASSLADIRAAMRRWLPAAGATREDVNDLLVAVGEAASNVVEHAYGPQGGTITVRLEVQGSQVVATVCDAGHWRPPRGENRGRGTLLMERCSDAVDVARGETGTQVLMRRAIGRGPRR